MLTSLVSPEASLPGLQMATFLLSPPVAFFLYRHSCCLFCYKDTVLLAEGPNFMTSFNYNYLLKDPVAQCSYILSCWRVGLEHIPGVGEEE